MLVGSVFINIVGKLL